MKKQPQSTVQLMNISAVTDNSLKCVGPPVCNEILFFVMKPDNLSVLSESALSGRIFSFTAVLKSLSEVEIICLNSRESFDENKLFIRKRIDEEANSAVRKLLEKDLRRLDEIQAQTATAREFLLAVRLENENGKEKLAYINRIEKLLHEAGFTARAADGEDIKRLLAVYFEQNVTTYRFENADGERWII